MTLHLATRTSPATLIVSSNETDKRVAIFVFLATAVAILAPGIMLRSPELMAIGALGIAAAIALEPKLGLYGSLAIVAIDAASFDPLTAPFGQLFASVPGIKATPVELLILWTTVVAVFKAPFDGRAILEDKGLILPAGLLMVLLSLAIFRGISAGGDFTIALWEVRGLLIVLPMMVVAGLLLTTRKELKHLCLAVMCLLALMSAEVFWRYITLVRSLKYQGAADFAFAHETAPLVAVLVTGCMAWVIWGHDRKQRLFALCVAGIAGIVLLTMRRRAGLIACEAGILALGMFLYFKNRRAFLIVAPVAMLLVVVYMAVFWNSYNSLGQPARAFRAVFQPEQVSARDQASDSYRVAETANIWYNIHSSPVQGLGFGVPYAKPVPMVDISAWWPFWDYLPHNSLLWVWMRAGAPAFAVFWFLLGGALARLVRTLKEAEDPWVITAAATIGAFVPMIVLFSYVDLGLTSTRLMILLGAGLGLIPLIERLGKEDAAAERKAAAQETPAIPARATSQRRLATHPQVQRAYGPVPAPERRR